MSTMNNPTIVVPVFNRYKSLARLLTSLSKAEYPGKDIKLVISVDHSDQRKRVVEIAKQFCWAQGEKEIIVHDEHLGLREHILRCGDLAEIYGSIILLEDDLYVSPYFFIYALRASQAYADVPRIAGISLYAHAYNETSKLTFVPYNDGYSNYFVQLASSWGQSWSDSQWKLFRQWYDKYHSTFVNGDDLLPPDVINWPETSWKKHFIRYMISEDKYFVYPRVSLTTNFMEPGTHHKTAFALLQVPLQNGSIRYNFSTIEESLSIYDAHCEPVAEILVRLSPSLSTFQHEFVVDLYGTKNIDSGSTAYVLSSRPCQAPILTWGCRLKPHESNLYADIEGGYFCLGRAADYTNNIKQDFFKVANYYNSLSYVYFLKLTAELTMRNKFLLAYLAENKNSLRASGNKLRIREGELNIKNKELRISEEKLKASEKELKASEKKLDAVLKSRSWKLTYPIRRTSSFLRNKFFR